MTTRQHRSVPADAGFSLIELIVVIGIIGILAAIVVPTYTSVQTGVRNAATQSDLGDNRTALVQYTVDNSGSVPAQTGFDPRSAATDLTGYGWSQSAETTGYHYSTNAAQTAWCLDMTNATGSVFRVSTNTDSTTGSCSGLAVTAY